eukprot:tig00000093_g3651.t1
MADSKMEADASIWIALIISVLSGLFTVFTTIKQAAAGVADALEPVPPRYVRSLASPPAAQQILTAAVEEQKREKEEWMQRKQMMDRYKGPLAQAAFELQSRLTQVAGPSHMLNKFKRQADEARRMGGGRDAASGSGFFSGGASLSKSGVDVRPVEDDVHAINHTLYLIAAFFGWTEIIRREVSFLEDMQVYKSKTVLQKIGSIFGIGSSKERDAKEAAESGSEIRMLREAQEDIIGAWSLDPSDQRRWTGIVEAFSSKDADKQSPKEESENREKNARLALRIDSAYSERFLAAALDERAAAARGVLQLYKGDQVAMAELVIDLVDHREGGAAGAAMAAPASPSGTLLGRYTVIPYTEFCDRVLEDPRRARWFEKARQGLLQVARCAAPASPRARLSSDPGPCNH